MKEKFKDFFSFSRGEQCGIIVLVIIIISLLFLPKVLSHFQEKDQFNYIDFKNEIIHFKDSLVVREKEKKAVMVNLESSSYTKSKKQRKRSKQDVVREKTKITYKRPKSLVNVNTADSIQLMSIYGIGHVLSKRIIKYRNLLGGFYKKDQLLEVYGIDSVKYFSIDSEIYIDSILIQKINLNSKSIYSLLYHPYVTKYEGQAIINYKKFKGTILSLNELVENNLISQVNFNKIKYYLKLN